jgi:HEAT repeat protein
LPGSIFLTSLKTMRYSTIWGFWLLSLAAGPGCARGDDLSLPSTAPSAAPTRRSTTDTAPAHSEPRLADGLTLAEWRQRIKQLDPNSDESVLAVPGLIELVKDRSVPWFTRRQAALTLGRMGPRARSAIPALIELLKEEPVEEVTESPRVWGVKALALFKAEARAAAPLLISQLNDESQPLFIREVPVEALSQIGGAHPAVVPALIDLLDYQAKSNARLNPGEDAALRRLAAEGLGIIGPDAANAIPALIRAAGSDDDNLRRHAIVALGAMGERGVPALPTFVHALAFDSSPAIRDAAADAMARIGPGAVPVLIGLLDDNDAEVRWRAAIALGTMSALARSALPRLEHALQDGTDEVRISAAESIWKIEPTADRAACAAAGLLTSPDRRIRMRSLKLLVEMGSNARGATGQIRLLLTDRRPYVQQIARKALEKLSMSDADPSR